MLLARETVIAAPPARVGVDAEGGAAVGAAGVRVLSEGAG